MQISILARVTLIACATVSILAGCSSGGSVPWGLAQNVAGALAQNDVVYRFKGMPDAAMSYAGLLAGTNGEFYGVSNGGGVVGPSGIYDAGTVFEVSASGTESVLYTFQGGTDGLGSEAGLIAGKGGVLYGDTDYGGGATFCSLSGITYGCGTVFELTPSGSGYKHRVLYAFQGGNDGALPLSNLVIDKSGALYGTTSFGGGSTTCGGVPSAPGGCGTVFKLTPSGSNYTETVLHSFQGGSDGALPADTLIADASSALYGTTQYGGGTTACTSPSGTTGCGTVFKLTPLGTGYSESILYSFKGGINDGSRPRSALLRRRSTGKLYGSTLNGGGSGSACGGSGCGTVFEVTTSGKERVLHSFGVASGDGLLPYDQNGLYADKNGDLYGTTSAGGTAKCACGTVFKLTSSAHNYTETVLYSFNGARRNDGSLPRGSLAVDAAGTLYGTTYLGGTRKNYGIVFKVSP
jgi:uncharacterized repeat protein (TIGR03803 family)